MTIPREQNGAAAVQVNMTVGEIAAHIPAALNVFERLNIDYSCAGTKSLAHVCRERGLRTEAVMCEIEKARTSAGDSSADWTEEPLSRLIEYIVSRHHWYTWAELPRLDRLISRILQAYHPDYPERLLLLSGVFRGLRLELEHHMTKEQTQVFPLITQLERFAELNGQLPKELCEGMSQLVHEHELSSSALKEMRQVTRDYSCDDDATGTYRALMADLQQLEADLHIHIHLESNILFPRVRKLLDVACKQFHPATGNGSGPVT